LFLTVKFPSLFSVAYLECAKGEGPGGLGDGSPTTVGSRAKAPVGGLGDEDPQKLKLFC